MALSDTRLRSLKPRQSAYQVADGGGLFVEVLTSGKRVWRLRYRLGNAQEKVTLGEYPAHSLTDARLWREECRKAVARGQSPMRLKQAKKVEARDDAEAHAGRETRTVRGFAEKWLAEVVEKDVRDPTTIKRCLVKDVYPAIGKKRLAEVTPADILDITDKIKDGRGSPHAALLTRNILKRLFDFAIAKHRATTNPAAAVQAKYIAKANKRERVLTLPELGELLRGIYRSDMRRTYKIALHLLAITMIRKSELLLARWDEFDLDEARWNIPAERTKMQRPFIVPLSSQAIALLRELYRLACGSPFLFPSRRGAGSPISKTAINTAFRAAELETPNFVIHDFRRTASTLLNEAGHDRDVIEKALAHEQGGVRGVYNRAAYLKQREAMLGQWADLVGNAIADDGNVVPIGRKAQRNG
jgi:integrase